MSTAADSAEMRDALQNWKIDLIVLDRILRGEDGLNICQTLRKTSRVPIVILTVLRRTLMVPPGMAGRACTLSFGQCRLNIGLRSSPPSTERW